MFGCCVGTPPAVLPEGLKLTFSKPGGWSDGLLIRELGLFIDFRDRILNDRTAAQTLAYESEVEAKVEDESRGSGLGEKEQHGEATETFAQ